MSPRQSTLPFVHGMASLGDPKQDAFLMRVLAPYEEPFYGFLDSTTEYSTAKVQECIRLQFLEYVLGGIERGIDSSCAISSTIFEVAMAMAISEKAYGESLRESVAMDRLLARKVIEWSDEHIVDGLMGKTHKLAKTVATKRLWDNAGRWAEMPIVHPRQEWGKEEQVEQPEG